MNAGNAKRRSTVKSYLLWIAVLIGILVVSSVWHFMTRPQWRTIEGQDHVVGFSSDGRVLATIGKDGIGYLWDPETGLSRDDLAGKVTGLQFPFSPDGRYHVTLLPANVDTPFFGAAAVVETKSKRRLFKFDYDTRMTLEQRKLSFTSDGEFFFSMGAMVDHKSSVWSLPDGKKVFTDSKPLFAISNNGEKVARYNPRILEVVRVHDGGRNLRIYL
jgi:WD40 repeat protein